MNKKFENHWFRGQGYKEIQQSILRLNCQENKRKTRRAMVSGNNGSTRETGSALTNTTLLKV